jgi:hypothetical protein
LNACGEFVEVVLDARLQLGELLELCGEVCIVGSQVRLALSDTSDDFADSAKVIVELSGVVVDVLKALVRLVNLAERIEEAISPALEH